MLAVLKDAAIALSVNTLFFRSEFFSNGSSPGTRVRRLFARRGFSAALKQKKAANNRRFQLTQMVEARLKNEPRAKNDSAVAAVCGPVIEEIRRADTALRHTEVARI